MPNNNRLVISFPDSSFGRGSTAQKCYWIDSIVEKKDRFNRKKNGKRTIEFLEITHLFLMVSTSSMGFPLIHSVAVQVHPVQEES